MTNEETARDETAKNRKTPPRAFSDKQRALAVAGAAFAVLLSLGASLAWAQDPAAKAAPLIVGQWKLNAGKSHLRLAPGSVELRQYQMRPDGFLTGLLITMNAKGYHYLQFTAKSDGKDYAEYSDEITGDMIAADTPTPRTYAQKTIDGHVTEWTDKKGGRVTAQGRKIVSEDGKTLTITVDGRPLSQARVYDRQ